METFRPDFNDDNPPHQPKVKTGFPSPADDYIERKLDLNEYLIRHPSSTFFIKVKGHSMNEAGVHNGDILVVDRSLSPANDRMIVAVLNGEMTVRFFKKIAGKLTLGAGKAAPVDIPDDADFQVWGVVTYVIHAV